MAEIEAAYQRARSKPEEERTELERDAFSRLEEFDEEHDRVNEFRITELTASTLVLEKANGTGSIRLRRPQRPLRPATFFGDGASETEDR